MAIYKSLIYRTNQGFHRRNFNILIPAHPFEDILIFIRHHDGRNALCVYTGTIGLALMALNINNKILINCFLQRG